MPRGREMKFSVDEVAQDVAPARAERAAHADLLAPLRDPQLAMPTMPLAVTSSSSTLTAISIQAMRAVVAVAVVAVLVHRCCVRG